MDIQSRIEREQEPRQIRWMLLEILVVNHPFLPQACAVRRRLREAMRTEPQATGQIAWAQNLYERRTMMHPRAPRDYHAQVDLENCQNSVERGPLVPPSDRERGYRSR